MIPSPPTATPAAGPVAATAPIANAMGRPRSFVSRKAEFKKTIVRRRATIGANATVVCGNEIGGYAFVGAGAVITQRVPDYALMVGIPARRIGWMSRAGERLGPTLVCSRDGSRYREKADGLLEYIDAEP